MGKIGGEHDAIDAHVMTELDRHALDMLHAEEDVLSDVLARPLLERLEVEEPRGPVAVPLVPVVGLLHPERHPAQAGLGEKDLQLREAVEHAGQDELGEAHGRRRPQERQRDPFHQLSRPELRQDRRIDSRILEGGLRSARAQAVEADVHGQGHLHVDRGRPEAIVLGRRIGFAAREHAQVDALEPELHAVLELGDRVGDVGPRDDAEADEAIARHRAVLLPEPVVVGADRRTVHVLVGDRAPEPRPHLHVREEHLGVQRVHVLFLEALLRGPHAGRVVDCHAERLPGLVRPSGSQVEERSRIGRLALDEEGVPAVGQLDRPRRVLAMLRGHARRPSLGPDFQVTVAGDQGGKTGAGHGGSPLPGVMVPSARRVVTGSIGCMES